MFQSNVEMCVYFNTALSNVVFFRYIGSAIRIPNHWLCQLKILAVKSGKQQVVED